MTFFFVQTADSKKNPDNVTCLVLMLGLYFPGLLYLLITISARKVTYPHTQYLLIRHLYVVFFSPQSTAIHWKR